MSKIKITIPFLEAGMGHIINNEATVDVLRKHYGDKVEIDDYYVSKDVPVMKKFEKSMVENVKWYGRIPFFGLFHFLVMHIISTKFTKWFVHHTVYRKATQEMLNQFVAHKPDIIIANHFSIAYWAYLYKQKFNKNCLVVVNDPDPDVHGWWDNRVDLFLVNNKIGYNEAIKKRHVPESKLRLTSFVCRDTIIQTNESKEFYRNKHGIPTDKFCVVLADGAYAHARSRAFTKELIKTDKPISVVLIAGKNKSALEEFGELAKHTKPNVTLIVKPFMREVHEVYRASDLFITKGGPNAIQDSLFMGTPVVVNCCPTPIEKATKDMFTKHYKCGEYITNEHKARIFVEKLIDNPSLLDVYQEDMKFFDKYDNGAKKTVDFIMEEYEENFIK